MNYEFMQRRLDEFGIHALIGDYSLAEGGTELTLVKECLQLAAPVLFERPDQLAAQLWGRMATFTEPGIRRLLDSIVQNKKEPWLRPASICLTPPGGPLRAVYAAGGDNTQVDEANRMAFWAAREGVAIYSLKFERVLSTLESKGGVFTLHAVRNRLYLACANGDIAVYDYMKKREVARLSGHSSPAHRLFLHGNQLVSVSGTESIVWQNDRPYAHIPCGAEPKGVALANDTLCLYSSGKGLSFYETDGANIPARHIVGSDEEHWQNADKYFANRGISLSQSRPFLVADSEHNAIIVAQPFGIVKRYSLSRPNSETLYTCLGYATDKQYEMDILSLMTGERRALLPSPARHKGLLIGALASPDGNSILT